MLVSEETGPLQAIVYMLVRACTGSARGRFQSRSIYGHTLLRERHALPYTLKEGTCCLNDLR